MTQAQPLRALQSRLSERLAETGLGDALGAQWLAVQVGAQPCLLPMRQIGEIFSLAPLTPLPHARPWFMGVANLRGALCGVVDLARWLALPAAPDGGLRSQGTQRLITLHPELGVNCALSVAGLLGMRRLQALHDRQDDPAAWVAAHWRDDQNQSWLELDLSALAQSSAFLNVTE